MTCNIYYCTMQAGSCIQDIPQMKMYTFGSISCTPVSYDSCRESTCRHVLPVNGCNNSTEVKLTVSTSNAFGPSTSLPLPICKYIEVF